MTRNPPSRGCSHLTRYPTLQLVDQTSGPLSSPLASRPGDLPRLLNLSNQNPDCTGFHVSGQPPTASRVFRALRPSIDAPPWGVLWVPNRSTKTDARPPALFVRPWCLRVPARALRARDTARVVAPVSRPRDSPVARDTARVNARVSRGGTGVTARESVGGPSSQMSSIFGAGPCATSPTPAMPLADDCSPVAPLKAPVSTELAPRWFERRQGAPRTPATGLLGAGCAGVLGPWMRSLPVAEQRGERFVYASGFTVTF